MARSKAPSATLLLACAAALSTGCENKADAPQPAATAGQPEAAKPAPTAAVAPAANKESANTAATAPAVAELSWRTDEAAAVAESKASRLPMFVDVSAKWCAPCVDLDNKTFTDPALAKILGTEFVPLKLDVTEQTDEHKRLQEKYGAPMLPMLVVLSPDGNELLRLDGFLGADELRAKLASLPKS